MLPKNKWLAGTVSAVLITSATYWEGTRYTPYEDVAGILTVCQGYAGPDVVKGKRYTPEECKALLTRELKKHGEGMLGCVKVPLTPYQYDAFTLFTYNVGVGAFCKSKSVLAPLNKGDYSAACAGMLKWSYVNGNQFSQGLYNRRQYEYKMCMGELNVKKPN